jgi:8-oxo-dGTP diphosphatase
MLNVVAAVIHNTQGKILIAQRPLEKHQGGLWEFAGGKVDANETPAQALVRELQEELDITATQYRSLLTVEHHYPDKSVRLQVFRVTAFEGDAHGAEGQPTVWVNPEQLQNYAFPAANTPILKAAVLPNAYYITPEADEVGGDLLVWLQARLQSGMTLCLRAKNLSKTDYCHLAQQVAQLCSEHQVSLMLHTHADLLNQIPSAVGVHLPFKELILQESVLIEGQVGKLHKKYLAVSCHNTRELEMAWQLGADFATLSPVNNTLSHVEQSGMGWQKFGDIVQQAKLPVYALGGMKKEDIPLAQQYGAQGVAAIRGLFS